MAVKHHTTPPSPVRKRQRQVLLTVMIPIYNEERSLVKLLPEWVSYCQQRGWHLILVNDGSTDNTAYILEMYEHTAGVTVLHHKVNRGYGGAIKTGILNTSTPYVVTMDADGQHAINDVDRILHFAQEQDADLVVGRRQAQSSSLYRETGKIIIRSFARLLMPLPIVDLNSGFKLYRTALASKYIRLCPDSMAFSDIITLLFIHQRHRVLEYPITVQPRRAGTSTITMLTAVDTLVEILHLAVLLNPLRVFLPISFLFCLTGIGWGVPFVLMGKGVSVGAMLAIVIGVLSFFLGLIVSQISALRFQILENDVTREIH